MDTSPSKSQKKTLELWTTSFNRIKSAHSFGKIRTWNDFLLAAGQDQGVISYVYPSTQLTARITLPEIKHYFDCLKLSLEMEWKEKAYEEFLTTARDKGEIVSIRPQPVVQYPYEFEGTTYTSDSSGDVVGEVIREAIADSYKLEAEEINLPECALQKCNLFHFQARACKELLEGLKAGKRAQLLLAAAGLGKTFILGAVVARLKEANWTEGKTYSPWPIIYITKAPIVTQTQRVLKEFFSLDESDILVINIEQMRSKFGEMFVTEKTKIVNGTEVLVWTWRNNIYPLLLIIDESQSVKNTDSIQSQIFQSYNEIKSAHTYQIHSSATPFTKVAEAKVLAVACHLHSTYCGSLGRTSSLLTNSNWPEYSLNVADPADPKEHSPASVERLMKELLPFVVDVKGVRLQFNAINKVEMINFETEEDHIFYETAWERWQRDRARIEGEHGGGGGGNMAILAAFTKFRQAAELCRARILAKRAYHKIQEGFSPVIAACFKTTIVKVVGILVTEYHIPRSKISLIWGGKSESRAKSLKKKEIREKLAANKNFLDELAKMGSSMEDLGLTTSDIAELMDEEAEKLSDQMAKSGEYLGLGIQSKKQRQEEIDKFQSGKSDVCIFTFKAGGVGLSLHHCDDMTEVKVRRKKDSNWAHVEDIPMIPIRPRSVDATPTYSAIELVQGLGRCPRLTSLSNTPQSLLFFLGTIEEDVATSVSMKLRCLKKVVRSREHWEDVIIHSTGKRVEAIPSDDDSGDGGNFLEDIGGSEDDDRDDD